MILSKEEDSKRNNTGLKETIVSIWKISLATTSCTASRTHSSEPPPTLCKSTTQFWNSQRAVSLRYLGHEIGSNLKSFLNRYPCYYYRPIALRFSCGLLSSPSLSRSFPLCCWLLPQFLTLLRLFATKPLLPARSLEALVFPPSCKYACR